MLSGMELLWYSELVTLRRNCEVSWFMRHVLGYTSKGFFPPQVTKGCWVLFNRKPYVCIYLFFMRNSLWMLTLCIKFFFASMTLTPSACTETTRYGTICFGQMRVTLSDKQDKVVLFCFVFWLIVHYNP